MGSPTADSIKRQRSDDGQGDQKTPNGNSSPTKLEVNNRKFEKNNIGGSFEDNIASKC